MSLSPEEKVILKFIETLDTKVKDYLDNLLSSFQQEGMWENVHSHIVIKAIHSLLSIESRCNDSIRNLSIFTQKGVRNIRKPQAEKLMRDFADQVRSMGLPPSEEKLLLRRLHELLKIAPQKPAVDIGKLASRNVEEIARTLPTLSKADRKDFLRLYYSARKSWNPGKGKRPPLSEFLDWLDTELPHRREFHLAMNDLFNLDKNAYKKVFDLYAIDDDTGLRSAEPKEVGILIDQDVSTLIATAPSGADVFRALRGGAPEAPDMNRKHARAQYHVKKQSRVPSF